MAGILNSTERSLRSVFVGNIPYDATEEKLKEVFMEVGPVVSFRLVYDRETGKPKGYGFCEYKDQETAMSAMRNLNGFELNGRTLRVDNAANERTREEIRNLQTSLGGSFESPYGPEMDPDKAPEAISKAVASLPPEQMFELAKQMKQCIQTNPNEARNMLVQNPQLAYALLQALVVMRIVDPQVAMSILHRPKQTAPLVPQDLPPTTSQHMPWTGNATIPPAMVPNVPPPSSGYDPRSIDPRLREQNPFPAGAPNIDPRIRAQGSFDPRIGQPPPAGPNIRARIPGPASVRPPPQDQERADLIMKVLQLSDQQIDLLPPEQRQSILILREQISRGTT